MTIERVGRTGRERRGYVPPLRFHALTRFYDTAIYLGMNQERFKDRLIAQARIQPGHRVLDLGCGTGTLTIKLKHAWPDAMVVGLDIDARALAIARAKASQADVDVAFCRASAADPPFAPASFDRILSSLFFHHLTTPLKRRTLASVRSLLRPRGELHIADWGPAQNVLTRVAFLSVQLLDGFSSTNDSVRGVLPSLLQKAGFTEVQKTGHEGTWFGTLRRYRAASGPPGA